MTEAELWQARAAVMLPIVQAAANLVNGDYEITDKAGRMWVDRVRYNALKDEVEEFRRAAEEEANNAGRMWVDTVRYNALRDEVEEFKRLAEEEANNAE